MIKGRMSQMWYVDYSASILIFLIGLLIFIQFADFDTSDDLLSIEGQTLSDTFLSPGIPEDWYYNDASDNNVSSIGLTNGHIVDPVKFGKLFNIGYDDVKRYLPTTADFIVYFHNGTTLSIGGNSVYGPDGINETNLQEIEDPDEIVSIDRIVAYNGKLVNMRVVVWE